MLDLKSCHEALPLVAFDGAAERAAILNYNLPASTTFTVRLFIPVAVPDEFWNEGARTLPGGSIYVEPPPEGESSGEIRPVGELENIKIKEDLKNLVTYFTETKPSWDLGPDQPEPPDWKTKTKQIETLVRELGASDPALKVLAGLNVAADLKAETLQSAMPTGFQMMTLSLKPGDKSYSPTEAQPIYNTMVLLKGLCTGKLPVWNKTFYGRTRLAQMMWAIKEANPQLFVIEELEIASFLGNYGAGKTVKTFSLLPGEKTTISVRTWRTEKTEQYIQRNILDSYSEESADEFERQLENERATSMQTENIASTAFSSNHSSQTSSAEAYGGGGGFDFFGLVEGNGGYNASNATTVTDANSTQSNASTSRSNVANTVQKALDRHVNQSSTARKHEVNVESKESVSVEMGQEETITRELQNINHSRVLNFVFRVLNQEFLTIVYLKDVSFGFTKGIPGDGVASKLDNLDNFLSRYLISGDAVKTIRNAILEDLLAVFDFEGTAQSFVEKVDTKLPAIEDGPPKLFRYWRKNAKLEQEWEGKRVKGVILSTAKRILPTDAIIVEALLGQGEALDCYNMRLQNAAADKADLENERVRLGLEILKSTPDAMEAQAEAFAQMFNPPPEQKNGNA